MKLLKKTAVGQRRVYDIEVEDVHNFYANGVNVHNCATAGGVSVIKDDGTVVDSNYSSSISSIAFDSYLAIHYLATSSTTYRYTEYPAYLTDNFGQVAHITSATATASPKKIVSKRPAEIAYTSVAGGINNLNMVYGNDDTGLQNYTTSDYTTGWMPGSIKLAALADTTAETFGDAVSGATVSDPNLDGVFDGEHVTNGDFATNTDSGWTRTIDNGWDFSGGAAAHTGATGGRIRQAITTVVGRSYVCTFDLDTTGDLSLSNTSVAIRNSADNNSIEALLAGDLTANAAKSYVLYFTATETTHYIAFYSEDGATLDNISVRLADPDRSVNGNGLAVHGSITKAPVATGADVVAYSGFDASNYLEQPNSIIPTGLNDLLIMGWMKRSSDRETIVSYEHPTAGNGFALLATWNGNGKLSLFTGRGSTNRLTTFDTVPSGVWNHFAVWRSNQIWYGAVNGVVSAIGVTADQDDFAVGGNLKVGLQSLITGNAFGGSLALIRISATVPTADQIRKIYEDEKVLFQENAKATLTGTSDAVTALAHDPDTELLHVGTSGGRSVFQGLRRVEEHTGTNSQSLAAISAVDGLVVEGK